MDHELFDFMGQVTREMSDEYERIRRRALEDPGTAGDEGEEDSDDNEDLRTNEQSPPAVEEHSSFARTETVTTEKAEVVASQHQANGGIGLTGESSSLDDAAAREAEAAFIEEFMSGLDGP